MIVRLHSMTGKQILIDTEKRHPNNHHPRLIFTEEGFSELRAKRNDGVYKKIIDKLIADCDNILTEEPTRFFIPDGIRLLQACRRVSDRVMTLSMIYHITGDEKYAERAYRELEAAAEYPNWNPKHFLDVGEMTSAFGLGYDWLYNYMTPARREKLRRATVKMGLIPALDDFHDLPRERTYRWFQDNPGDNWKFICGAGLTMCCLAMFDDEEDRAIFEEIAGTAYDDCYKAVRNFYSEDDGAYCEGPTYWEYATNFLEFLYCSLTSAAGTDYGLTDWVGLAKSPYFILSVCSPDFTGFNFGDASECRMIPRCMSWFGTRFGDTGLTNLRVKDIMDGRGFTVHDLFFKLDLPDAPLDRLPVAYVGKGHEHASMRTDRTPDAFFAAIHYGYNDACHGHLDIGTFIVNIGNKRFFSDLGPDNYNLIPYRGTYRYRAEGHNTIVFNPSPEEDQVREGRAYVDRCNADGDSFVISDISGAFRGQRVSRGMRMYRDIPAVVIRDEIECLPTDLCDWHAHTSARIDLSDDCRTATLDIDGTKLRVRIMSPDGKFEIRPAEPDETSPKVQGQRNQQGKFDEQAKNPRYKKLTIRLTGKSAYAISVAMSPVAEDGTDGLARVKDLPLADWQ